MKILLAHFKIQDWGGIVNYSELLAQGLKSIGHKVDSVMLKNKGNSGYPKTKNRSNTEGWEYGEGLGLWMHQKNGWEGMYQLNYSKDVMIGESWNTDYDLVIYVVPVPNRSKDTEGDTAWLKLFDNSSARQILVIHDGNMEKLYPYILNICEKVIGIICVHDAAFNSCSSLPVRRAFIPNPHNYDPLETIVSVSDRRDGFISLQTFKRWKRVDDLVRAIPFMDEFHEKIICGGGIEYCYMTSKTKCKPEYKDLDGKPIWESALESGMEFMGYIDTTQRDNILKQMKLLIDPSWSLRYSELGSHFNRVMVEAMCLGCVPVCTDLAMKNSFLFKPGIHYIEMPYDAEPEQYASIINNAIEDEELLQSIQNNNLKLLAIFDKEYIAEAIIEFSWGGSGEIGKVTDKIINNSKAKMEHFEGW